ncbi:MAG: hypothetical protein ACR2JS_05165 [Candidatus Nanopelagicales bacterium]
MSDGGVPQVGLDPAASLSTVAYAMFAFQQQLPLSELHPESAGVTMRSIRRQSPEWFAAAADDDASLLQTAPELLAMSSTDADPLVPRDSDIIGIYAPNSPRALRDRLRLDSSKPSVIADAEQPPHASGEANSPRTSVQMGLLRELDALDL